MMSDGGERIDTREETVYDVMRDFTGTLFGILQVAVLRGGPREQMRHLINLLHGLGHEMEDIVYFIRAPEEMEDLLVGFWDIYYGVLDDLQALSEVEAPRDVEISTFQETSMVLVEYLSDLLADIIEVLDIGEESASVLREFNTELQLALQSHRPEEEIQSPVADESNNDSPEFDILVEENSVSYIYKKIQNMKNEEGFKDSCIICLCDLEDDAEARRLPCLHVYHKRCVDGWLRINWGCPVCRFDIREETENFPHIQECCVAE